MKQHNSESDCWLIIGNDNNGMYIKFEDNNFKHDYSIYFIGGEKVYDITKYLNDHPGGSEIMLEFAGKSADDMFEDIGHSSEARNTMKKYLIGKLKVS